MDGMLLSGMIDRSVIAWYCVLLIFFVRLFLKRISRKYCYYLWLVVFLNLCIPFSIVSSFSLIPQRVAEFSMESREEVNPEVYGEINEAQNIVFFSENDTIVHDKEVIDILPDMESERAEDKETNRSNVFSKEFLLIWRERIWILGIVLLGIKSIFAIFQLNRKIRKGHDQVLDEKERIVVLQDLVSPILWGFLSPAIYLPKDLEEEERVYIIEHEKCHRKRKDYLMKPVLYAITVIYWFHPLVWMAYHLCCKDMEMSCDEMVLEKAGKNIRREYAYSLLKYAAKQNGFLLNPLTFGEPSVRSRIEYILKYKKKSVSVTAAAMVVAAAVGIGLILRPADESGSGEIVTENTDTEILLDDDTRVMADGKPAKNGTVLDETVETMIFNNGGEIIQVDKHIFNNDGEIIQADRNRYCMGGKPLYTNGEFLYRTNTDDRGTDHIWEYEMDQSSGREITSGTIVGMSENDKVLYYLKQEEGEEPSFWTYHTESKAMHKMYEGEDSYLAVDDEWVYHYGKKDGGLYINRNRLEKLEGEEDLLGTSLDADEISCFYVTDSHLLFAAGVHEGSGGYFYGDFYSFDLETKKLVKKHLTDDDSFAVFDGKIYYSKYSNEGNGESGLYCADFNLNNETLVGEAMEFVKGIEDKNRMLVSQYGRLLSVSPDGKEEVCIYDAPEQGWEMEEYDKIYFKDVNVIDDEVFAWVEQWGYREGNGWRDSLIASQKYQMLLDGSKSVIWSWGTEEVEQETAETLDDSSNPIPGQPCERPEEAGWDLQNVTDVRNDFFRMPLEPEEEKKDATYLLGKTENYTLYGKGDYETMLLECGGKYSEITYFYASNYMNPLQLFEADIDYDGRNELAIKFRLQMGTGISIDTFLLADFGKDNELYVHQYLAEEFTKQLAEALSFEKTEAGVQAMVNGKNAGPVMKQMDGRESFHEAGVGSIMHFYYDDVENEIQLSGDILFFADGVTYETNGNDVTAKINWDGETFFLSDFTSRNRYLDEQVKSELSRIYGRNLYDVNVNYDSSKMNQENMVISAEVLKTEADRSYEDVEIQLKRAKDSYISGWEISGDHVLKEINAVVEGNRTLTIKAIGKKREDMDLWGLCQIDVYEGSTKIQVIHLKDIIDIDGLDGSVGQGYTECWSKEELLQAKDVNFDGNQDMEIFAWITNTSIPYYYMLWNRNSGQFEYGFCIQLTELDYDNQQLVASHRAGAGTYYTDYYRYNENGELYLADVQIKDGEGNLINRQEPKWTGTTKEE